MKINNNDIKEFYDNESKKYYETRQKIRKDGQIILQEIKNYGKKEISMLEFGCGGGRLITYLNKNLEGIKINYIGIDLSDKLLDFAKKDNPNCTFICEDILRYIGKQKQENFDFIVGIASFQHIKSERERIFLINQIYNKLKYNGKLMMTNRSFSKWFIKKYIKEILSSSIKSLYNHKKWNDLYIPRKNKDKIYKRFYHIFTIKELKNLSKDNGFKINVLTYLDKKGQKCKNWINANNSLIICEKTIF